MALKRRPQLFVVSLDDGRQLTLSPDTVLQFALAPNKEIPEETLNRLVEQDTLRQAKDQAMHYLTRRPHSRRELQQKLRRKGFPPQTINQALDDLEKVKLIDDLQFARLFIENELTLRPVGKHLLRHKLHQRGIPDHIIDPLLEDAYQHRPEDELALLLAQKYLKTHHHRTLQKQKEGLIRFLQSKGFDWDITCDVLLKLGWM